MFDALYISATGMRGQQLQIDAIAQNVANLQTVGYRRNVVSFAEIVASLPSAVLGGSDAGADRNSHIHAAGILSSVSVSNTVGDLRATGDALNVAIDGPGFFEVIRVDGSPAYTRAGQLRVNEEGLLTVADGSQLAARIQIPPDARDLRILNDGRVMASTIDNQTQIELGRIELVTFSNPAALKPIGDNLYAGSSQTGEPQTSAPGDGGVGTLKQGFLENSNVQMADELVTMMLAQRAFELNSKLIQAADQMLGIANGLYR